MAKEPVTITKSVEVPVTLEEVSIETSQPPTGITSTSQKPITSKEDLKIPLKKEEIEVSKNPYLKGVVIKKKPVTETKKVIEDVTSDRVSTSNM